MTEHLDELMRAARVLAVTGDPSALAAIEGRVEDLAELRAQLEAESGEV